MNLHLQCAGERQPDFFDVMAGIGADMAAYDWHVSNLDPAAWPGGPKPGWIRGGELAARLAGESVQFIFAVFDAVPIGARPAFAEEPWGDGNTDIWEPDAVPQISGALFEIVYFDVSDVLLIGLDSAQREAFLRAFPSASLVR
jgi:hypothetical protein